MYTSSGIVEVNIKNKNLDEPERAPHTRVEHSQSLLL